MSLADNFVSLSYLLIIKIIRTQRKFYASLVISTAVNKAANLDYELLLSAVRALTDIVFVHCFSFSGIGSSRRVSES